MGVEETDLMGNILNVNNANSIGLSSSTANQLQLSSIDTFNLQTGSAAIYLSSNASEFEQTKFRDITIQMLKEDKKFVKLNKRQESKLQELLKEQQEEKQKTLKKQCQQLDRYLKQNNYSLTVMTQQQTKMLLKRKLTEQQQPNSTNSCSNSLNNITSSRPSSQQDDLQTIEPSPGTLTALNLESISKDEQIEQIINEQIKQWSILLDKQKKIEINLCKQQIAQQNEKLKKLLLREQAKQIKKMNFLFAKHIKDMKNRQAKISVDTYKEVIGDKTLRNKMERDRRLREKKCNNTKKFIEERRSAAIMHTKEMDRLKKMHTNQVSLLERIV